MRHFITATRSVPQQLGLVREEGDTPALRRKREERGLRQGKQDTMRWKVTQKNFQFLIQIVSIVLFQVLLANGADVNAGLTERSPLHYAVLSDAPEVVTVLLEAGACPDTPQVCFIYFWIQAEIIYIVNEVMLCEQTGGSFLSN